MNESTNEDTNIPPDERRPKRRTPSAKRSKMPQEPRKRKSILTTFEQRPSTTAMLQELRDAARELTTRQVKFVLAYMETGNATKAAQEMDPELEAPEASGSALLRQPHVALAISRCQDYLMAHLSLDPAWVVNRLRWEAISTGPGSTARDRIRALELLGKHLGILSDTVTHTHQGQLHHTAGHIHVSAEQLSPELCQRLWRESLPGVLDSPTLTLSSLPLESPSAPPCEPGQY